MKSIDEIIRELPENIRGPIYEALMAFRDDVLLKETKDIKFQIGKFWEAINELAKRLIELTERVNNLTERVNDLTESLVALTERVNNLTERVNDLTERLVELTERVNNLTERVNDLTKRLNELTERVNDLTKRLNNLTERVNDLTERLNDLTERVNNLTERVNDLTERLNELAERVNELTKRVGELAEAQKRTDQKVEELAEAQKRTEQRVYELVGVLQKLTEEHRKTREKLEGLSDSFGYLLEDRAMKSLPKILKENYKIEVVEKLKRDYFVVDGEYVEVNIFGRAKKEDKEYILLGESKSRVSKKAIDAFLRKCDKISKRFSKEPIKVFVSYIFTPEIKEYAEEKGIILVPSYELEL